MFFGSLYEINQDSLRKRVDELLDMVQLGPFKDKLVGGYSSGMIMRRAAHPSTWPSADFSDYISDHFMWLRNASDLTGSATKK